MGAAQREENSVVPLNVDRITGVNCFLQGFLFSFRSHMIVRGYICFWHASRENRVSLTPAYHKSIFADSTILLGGHSSIIHFNWSRVIKPCCLRIILIYCVIISSECGRIPSTARWPGAQKSDDKFSRAIFPKVERIIFEVSKRIVCMIWVGAVDALARNPH